MTLHPRIIFMGTPEFAAVCLEKMLDAGLNVVAVVTNIDKPAGRGKQLQSSAVKEFALKRQLPILQPTRLKDEDFIRELASFQADIQVVVAFRMLPEVVWSMPRYGTFNLHASLLPKFRGAAPIQYAIWKGEKESGVTTFLLDKEIDTGKILFQEKVEISAQENAGSLHDKLLAVGAPLIIKTVRAICASEIHPIPQDTSSIPEKYLQAPKIFKEDTVLDWEKTAGELDLQIRALSPYPAAITQLNIEGQSPISFKILKAKVVDHLQLSPGEFDTDGKSYFHIGCRQGGLSILNIQQAGKKALKIEDFLRGFRLQSHTARFS